MSKNILIAIGWFGLLLANTVVAALFAASFVPLLETFSSWFGNDFQLPEDPIVNLLLGSTMFVSLIAVEAAIYMRYQADRLIQTVVDSVNKRVETGLQSAFDSALFRVLFSSNENDSHTRAAILEAQKSIISGIEQAPSAVRPALAIILQNKASTIASEVAQSSSDPILLTIEDSMEISKAITEKCQRYQMVESEIVNPHEYFTPVWHSHANWLRDQKNVIKDWFLYTPMQDVQDNATDLQILQKYHKKHGFNVCGLLNPEQVKSAIVTDPPTFDVLEIFDESLVMVYSKKSTGYIGGQKMSIRFIDISINTNFRNFIKCLKYAKKIDDTFLQSSVEEQANRKKWSL